MKKISLLFLSVFLAASSYSQVTLGLRVAPAFCINRVNDTKNDAFEISNNGSAVRFAFGPTVDFKIGDNYAFSTGAWYMSTRASLTYKFTDPGVDLTYKEIVSLQSVQIPITFKAYTNEIATNMKLYFQLGGLASINFYEKFKESDPSTSGDYDSKYNVFDVSLYVGAGLQYKIGESNALFGGLFYSRGLMNQFDGSSIAGTTTKLKDNAKYNTDLIGLEVGLTF